MKKQIPEAALARLEELELEEKTVNESLHHQFGTSIPNLFFQAKTFVTNPSSVGTGVLSRMIETDDAVSSAIQFKILMIMAKIGEYHHEEAEINEFINGCLKRLRGPTWNESLESMLSAKAYGFSISEICFGIDENMRKVPVRIPTYHPSTIAFECDETGAITDDGVIQFVIQQSQYTNPNGRMGGYYGTKVTNPFTTPVDRLTPYRIPFVQNYGLVRIPRKKVIHMTNLPMFAFGSPYGKTEVRTAHLAWQLKSFLMRQLGICAKRNANGFIWATAPKGGQEVKSKLPGQQNEVQKSPRELLTDLLSKRENDDALVTGEEKDGYKLTMLPAGGTMAGYLEAINHLDVKIFRCFLLPSLVMTDGSAGSRALGDKHFEIVDRMAEAEATKFTQAIINDLIEPLIIENFGENKKGYGTFKQRPQGIEERERLANMFTTLTTSGIMKNHVSEDMDYMRQSLSLPKDNDKSFEIPDADSEKNTGDRVDDAPKDDDHPLQNGDENVQQSVLNGAQVSSMVTIVQQVATKLLPRESAIEIIMVAFNMTREQAEKILGEAGNSFVPSDDSDSTIPSDAK